MFKFIAGKYLRTVIYVVFSFLLGCMVTINLTPIEKTCTIDNVDVGYNIMQNSKLKNPELVILILSATNNLGKRDTIRETWLKLHRETYDNSKFKIAHYFVIGSLGLTADQLLHLSSEQSTYNDILILPVHDTYKTLTEKIKKSFIWLNDQLDYGLGFKYILKCDDDSFINLSYLPQEIINIEKNYISSDITYPFQPTSERGNRYLSSNAQVNNKKLKGHHLSLYWGYFSGNAKIKTTGKWAETDWIASDRYIPYALGGGYVLSKNLVTYIAKNANNLRSFNSEDISVGFWLAPVNNVLRVHDIRFDTEWVSRGCRNNSLVIHNISQREMRELYNHYISQKTLCSEEVVRRNYYIYNWSVPPSQCCKPSDQIKLSKNTST
ncbi:hypothetical protein NQ315_015705 [Exocentrus adspersus]|uniref:Hexosyltransferase n=1 Tax=Exocentrus adspersus TaxID=1586481 RepID=A0AAV8W2M3_9CUCU|nr:hypothetical protein NQ315_015705 [Exocentrus adspersus]